MIPQDWALRLQLAAIAGNEPPDSFLEVRPLDPPGRQAFVGVRDLDCAAAAITVLGERGHQVYVGAAPRVERKGSADAIERVWCLWADCDGREALRAVAEFRPLPSIVIRSGGDDHAHAYWPLLEPLSPAWAQRANRRLALALGADLAATDAARILRPTGTLNRKHDPPRPVLCTGLELDTFTFDRVVGGLADERAYTPPRRDPEARKQAQNGDASKRLDGLARAVREAQPGNRNQALYWAACRVAEEDLDRDRARGLLSAAAAAAGLGEREIATTLQSALGAHGLAATGRLA